MDSLHKSDHSRKSYHPPVFQPVWNSPKPSSVPDFHVEKVENPSKRVKSTLLLLVAGVFFLCLFSVGFILAKGYHTSQKIQLENDNPSFFSQIKGLTASFLPERKQGLRGEALGRINVLLLGRAGEHYPGKDLTDTIMIMSIDTNTKKVSLLSLPRDLYVPIHETELFTKLNSLYQYGLRENQGTLPLEKTLEDITGQPIHYFLTVDFDSFEKIIDTLGGIRIDAVKDFHDTRYPGKNYSYETFEMKKGWQTLDGKTALQYARERHDDPEGDFGRAKRQQQILQAVKEKAFSAGTLFNIFTVSSLLDTLGENIKTDITLEEMGDFLELSRTIDTQNITSVVIDAWKKDSLLRVSHVQAGNVSAFILVPRIGNWSEIQEISGNIFHLDDIREKNLRIADENPKMTIVYSRENSRSVEKIRDLLEEIGFKDNVFVESSSLAATPKKSIIVDSRALSKPFSLNELLKKFPLEQSKSLPFPLVQKETSDFVLVAGEDILENFSSEDSSIEKSYVDEPIYSEEFIPQRRERKQ